MQTTETSEVMTQARCAHQACRCILAIADAVCRNLEYFCCESCAEGIGCTHRDCDCASASAEHRGATR